MDIEYQYPFGWKEMWGLAYRTDFDLKNHMKSSGADLNYRDPKTGEKFIPHVIEPTFGLSRLLITVVTDSFREEEVRGEKRTVLKLPPFLSPVKAAVFPLQKDEKLQKLAKRIYLDLKGHFYTEYDDAGNIGKMYRRQDEIGTPYCITVDYDSLTDKRVTVRDRDTMKQERIPVDKLKNYVMKKLEI